MQGPLEYCGLTSAVVACDWSVNSASRVIRLVKELIILNEGCVVLLWFALILVLF